MTPLTVCAVAANGILNETKWKRKKKKLRLCMGSLGKVAFSSFSRLNHRCLTDFVCSLPRASAKWLRAETEDFKSGRPIFLHERLSLGYVREFPHSQPRGFNLLEKCAFLTLYHRHIKDFCSLKGTYFSFIVYFVLSL